MDATGPESSNTISRNALITGGVLLAIAAAMFIGSTIIGSGEGDDDVSATACTLAASGLSTIKAGASRAEAARALIAAAGPALGSLACNKVVSTLTDDPTEPIDLELARNDGTVQNLTISGNELVTPPPSSAPAELSSHKLECLRWGNAVYYRACLLGYAPYPPHAAPTSGYR